MAGWTSPARAWTSCWPRSRMMAPERPQLRLLIAGRGDTDEVLAQVPAAYRDRVVLLGQVSDADRIRMLHSVDVFCAPNTGGESFGYVLVEAMASGAPIVASDLDAFRQVLRGGEAGELFEHRERGRAGCGRRTAARRPGAPGDAGGCGRQRPSGSSTGRWSRAISSGFTRRSLRRPAGWPSRYDADDQHHRHRRPGDTRGLHFLAGRPPGPAARAAGGGQVRAGRGPGAAQLDRAGAGLVRPARPGHERAARGRGARRPVGRAKPGRCRRAT